MMSRNDFFHWLLSLKKQLDAERKPANSYIIIDRGDDDDEGIIVVQNYQDSQYIHVTINDIYVQHEPEIVAAILAIRAKEYDEKQFPDVKHLVHIAEYNYPAYNAGHKDYHAGTELGTKTYRIDHSTLTNLFAEKMMEKISTVFGSGTSDKQKQVRDRRHNTLYVKKNVSPLQDELLREAKDPTEINVYLDTSGSIGFEEAMLADAVVALFRTQYPRCKLNMYSFSTEVRSIEDFSWDNVKSIIDGGTLLNPVLEHMEANPCKINVVIGDMYFSETRDELENPVPENIVWISTVISSSNQQMWHNMKAKEELCFAPPTEQSEIS